MASNGEVKSQTPNASSPEDMRAEIERTRAQIADSAAALRQEVAEVTDWREWVRARPLVFMGAALAVGFIVGYRSR